MEENVQVPKRELDLLKQQAGQVPELEERERVLRGLMSEATPRRGVKPRRRPKRQLTPQEKAERAKRKQIRNAQREARKQNRRRK